ncbi:uncharacterized protein [Oscarella lobularis]|uniref:uncharacterized protein isoform X2 n=1 Tax=Oscarella lobularis TaxID=121494 RepID=UPI0033135146
MSDFEVQFDENVAEKKELELILERAKHELEAERQEANELRKKLAKKEEEEIDHREHLAKCQAEIERLRLRLKTVEQDLKEKQKSPTPRPNDEFPAQGSKNDYVALPQVPTIWVTENEENVEYKEEESAPKTEYLRPQYYSTEEKEEQSLGRRSSMISQMSVWVRKKEKVKLLTCAYVRQERLSQRRPSATANLPQTPRTSRRDPAQPVEKKIFRTTLDLGPEKTKSFEFPSLSIQPMNKTTRMSRTAGGPSPRRYYAKQRFY